MAIRKIPTDTSSFKFHNANPKNNRSSDCVLRAIVTATGKTWDEVLDDLVILAHKYKVMIDEPKCYEKYLESLGFVKMKQPRKSDNTKYTGSEFCKLLSKSYTNGEKIVAHIGGHHIVAIVKIDDRYKIVDTWDSSNGCIGKYWIKK